MVKSKGMKKDHVKTTQKKTSCISDKADFFFTFFFLIYFIFKLYKIVLEKFSRNRRGITQW